VHPLDTATVAPALLRRVAWYAVGLTGLLSVGCQLETDPPADTELRTTHAVVTIERSESADGTNSKAEALAGFLEVPALVDAHSVLQLVGLGLDLPEPGTCTLGSEPVSAGPLTETASVEFVDAGAVELEVSGAHERLAPYAFPTVTDSISGVLYTSRDRTADPLPSGSRYTLSADGLGIRASLDAPRALSGVSINGTPFAEVASVSTASPLDLTWDVDTARTSSAPGDIVYVELTASSSAPSGSAPSGSAPSGSAPSGSARSGSAPSDSARSGSARRVICSFGDELGAGSVPTEAFATEGTGVVAVHRLRAHEFDVLDGDSNRGQLRFDFAVAANVTFD